jgi:hypothetical protein
MDVPEVTLNYTTQMFSIQVKIQSGDEEETRDTQCLATAAAK